MYESRSKKVGLIMEKFATRRPVNKTAAVVTGKGTHYISKKVIKTADTHLPIPTRPVLTGINLTGIRIGRLTVVGLARDFNGRWVVRCDCGTFTLRRAKSIKNESNQQDRCEECRNLVFLKREERFRRTGKWKDIRDF